MPQLVDSESLRQFAGELFLQLEQCHNGEGNRCASIDATVTCYAQRGQALRDRASDWANQVFSGASEFSTASETTIKSAIEQFLLLAKRVADEGRKVLPDPCCEFTDLDRLNRLILELDNLRVNWIRPRRAVGPGSRIGIPKEHLAAAKKAMAKLIPPDAR